jgi:hypothetical protein
MCSDGVEDGPWSDLSCDKLVIDGIYDGVTMRVIVASPKD